MKNNIYFEMNKKKETIRKYTVKFFNFFFQVKDVN